MKKTVVSLSVLIITMILISSCSPVSTTSEVEEVSLPTAEIEPTALPDTPVPDEIMAEENDVSCEDPFDGVIPAFRTESWKTNFCLHSVDYADIIPGGPPRDGIPPIDSPRYEDITSADDWIENLEPVILLDHQGEARAYPLQIMTWHEIVNDTINGDPVVVTFCPLCNTALVFRRPIVDGELLTFGTSGNLRKSDLVMWDRQTESWWQQFTGEAIVGDLTGTRLEAIPAAIISWEDFKTNFPEGMVLSIETGYNRSYGRNPYAGYDNINSYPFLFLGDVEDGDIPPMARVVGLILENNQGAAFLLELLIENQVLNEMIGDQPVVIFWKEGTASALDSSRIALGRDIGSTGAFDPRVNDQVLTFEVLGDGLFQDQQTSSTWNHLGLALDGDLAGTQLIALPQHDTFWFAWAAFVPDLSEAQ